MSRGRVQSDATLADEASLISRYLVGVDAPAEAVALYQRALGQDLVLSERDQRLLTFMRRRPWSIGMLDAGLALSNKYAEVRRRIYVMFAILEARPEFCDFFLPKERSAWYVLVIGWKGIVGVLQSVCGAVLVKVIAR